MALTAGSNWGVSLSRFMATTPSDAVIIPVNRLGNFAAGGHDPFNGGAVFAADKFYRIGSSTGEKAYKPSYKTIEAKDELDRVLKRKNVLQGAEVSLVFNQDQEGFLAKNAAQRFTLVYREALREDGLVKFRVCPKVLFLQDDLQIPADGTYATYPVKAKMEMPALVKEYSYRFFAQVFYAHLLISANSGRKLYWDAENETFPIADIGPGGTMCCVQAGFVAAAVVSEFEYSGMAVGRVRLV